MKNSSIQDIKRIITNSKSIAIVAHVNPDGDAVASLFALTLILKQLNIKASPILLTQIPEMYKFLPLGNDYNLLADVEKNNYDTLISVDTGTKDRMGSASKIFDKATHTINIDHHKTNPYYAEYNYVDGDASSTGEVLFYIAKEMNIQITKEIAECLYVAILTDTGGFKHDNTNTKSMSVAAELLKFDIKPNQIYRKCFEDKPLARVRLNALALSKVCLACNNKIAYTVILLEDMKNVGAQVEHTEDIVGLLGQLDSTEAVFTVRETEQGYSRVSLRSKTIDISKIALIFDGGGHKFAAGCTIKKPYKTAINKIIEYLEKELECKNS